MNDDRYCGAETPIGGRPGAEHGVFTARVIIFFSLAALAFVAYKLSTLLLLVSGAVIIAVIIHLLADPLRRRLGLPAKLAVLISLLSLTILAAGALFLFGAKAAEQFDRLAEVLPEAISDFRKMAGGGPFGGAAQEFLSDSDAAASAADVAGVLRNMAGGLLTAMVYLVSTITAGVIFAMYPDRHRDGVLLLAPPAMRPRLREAVNMSGRALKGWLVGQLISMTLIGALTCLGLYLIGLPSWLALGLLAGVAQFVPVVGPILSAIPGLILAGSIDGPMFLKALGVYVGVQQLESNFITPFVMRQTASLPMALTLFSIIAFGLLFGPLGAVVATPITVSLYIMTQKLYLEGLFGEQLDIKGSSD